MRHNSNPVKIILSGYYGFGNAGDEALLYSIIDALYKEIDQEIEITVLSNCPEQTEKTFQVKAVNRWHLFSVIKAIRESELFISGGGSLLQDVTGPRSIIYYLGVVGIALLFNIPTFFYSHGIGPVNGTIGKKLIPLIANRVKSITVRDEKSKNLLEEMGVRKPVISVTADPVMGVDRTKIDLDTGKKILNVHRPAVGLALRNWMGFPELVPDLAKWCEQLLKQGYEVVFIPFHTPQDMEINRLVASQVSGSRCKVLEGGYSPMEYFSIVGNLHFLTGMRLHALIMAGVMGVPMAGIAYDPKVSAYLEQVHQPAAASLLNPCAGKKRKGEREKEQVLSNLNNAFDRRRELQENVKYFSAMLARQAREAAVLAAHQVNLNKSN